MKSGLKAFNSWRDQMKTVSKLFFSTCICLMFSSLLSAQNLVPIKMEISREIPGVKFTQSKFYLEYWLQVEEQFIGLVPGESAITTLIDDHGNDLLEGHIEAVRAREAYVEEEAKKGRMMFSSRPKDLLVADQAVVMKDTLGFKFHFDSWVLPSPETTSIQLKGKLVYLVTNPKVVEQQVSVACDKLGRETTVELLGKPIKITEAGSSSIGDERFISYQLPRDQVPVALTKVEVYNSLNKLVNDNPFLGGGAYNISVKQTYANQPVTIKFFYRELQRKEYLIDHQINLGL